MATYDIGSLVRCRGREWVVLPSPQEDVLLLRPLGGIEAETCGIYLPLEGKTITSATFPFPDLGQAGDFVSGALLRNAARLTLRSGAGPFRSLGRITIRPRPYQLVPLIMALRLDPVRLLIADDVGIGKTIEAALIARELLDRGEIRRLAVLCPPHLCDQWQRELAAKFAIDAVVVRSSTAAALERSLPRGDISLFEYYPFTVTSIDYVKSDRRRDGFVRSCPEFVIVDEAHAATSTGTSNQQQRYDLIRELAGQPDRHMLLLTATPHSGIEDAFRSLLALLAPRFGQFDVGHLDDAQRDDLARHFVQRRRGDVQRWLGNDDVTPFPERFSKEETYQVRRSPAYHTLFEDVYAFTRELVTDTSGSNVHQRARYWAALALLRCVMSSPAAAEKALLARSKPLDAQHTSAEPADNTLQDTLNSGYVYDPTEQDDAIDQEPGHVVEQGSSKSDHARLRRFAEQAARLKGKDDPKLAAVTRIVDELLNDGFNPIVYCRYIATANYLAAELGRKKSTTVRVLAVTGELSEEEREAKIAELEQSPRRLLVATDCLSEGINLQQAFDAVIHYDLPWNPNRLEQREGRVDRFGQQARQVRTVLLYGKDNQIDEAVMKVLLRKAVHIHRSLGISVPLPIDSGTMVESLIALLFTTSPRQLSLFDTTQHARLLDTSSDIQNAEQAWNRAIDREKASRTRFAQRRIKPEEVARELHETDAVLGDTAAVQRFVAEACARLGASLQPHGDHLLIDTAPLPQAIKERLLSLLPAKAKAADKQILHVSFHDPAPHSVETVSRNHPLTVALADYLLEHALITTTGDVPAARSGIIRSKAVQTRTVLLVLRVRMLIGHSSRGAVPSSSLAEELVVAGFTRGGGVIHWLDEPAALALLETAQPDANVDADARAIGLESALDLVRGMPDDLNAIAIARAERLRESHQRVRSATSTGRVTVSPRLPPDILGVYVVLPA